MGKAAVMPSTTVKPKQKTEPKVLLLPDKSASTERITEYLFGRGIDYSIIQYCIDKGLIFESLPYHNLVCVGFDEKNILAMRPTGRPMTAVFWVTAPAVTSTILFGSQTARAVRCISLSVPLTCFPMRRLKRWRAGLAERQPCFPRRCVSAQGENRGQHYPCGSCEVPR